MLPVFDMQTRPTVSCDRNGMQSFSILLSFSCSILAHPVPCSADALEHVHAAVCIVFMTPCIAQQLMPATCHCLTEASVWVAETQS